MATFQTGATQPMAGSYEAITVDDTAGGKALTATKYRVNSLVGYPHPTQVTVLAEEALITVETQPIRWTIDGTAPTTTVGHLAAAGDVIDLEGYDAIKNFRAIRSTGSSATIHVTYFRN